MNISKWVYHGTLPLEVSSGVPDSAKFIRNILAHPPTKEYAALLLFRLCSFAKQEGNEDLATNLYNRLVSEYHETAPAGVAMRMLWSTARVRVSGLLPDFTFASVDDTTLLYTKNSFRGRYVLLDFWAT